MLNFNHLTFGFSNNLLFDDVTVTIPESHIALIGKNGVGKTTLLRLISGELAPIHGSIHRPKHIYYVDFNLEHYADFFYTDLLAICRALQSFNLQKVDSYIQALRLEDFAKTPIGLCSKGTQKKIPLLMALCSNANLLLIDEPFESIDVWSNKGFVQCLQEKQCDYVIVTHDQHWIPSCSEAIYAIDNRTITRNLIYDEPL